MHASMHACVQRLCVSTYACMYAHIYTYTCMHVYYVYVAFAPLVLVLADVPPPALRGKDAHVFLAQFLFSPSPLLSLMRQAAIEAKMQMWLKAAEDKKRAEGGM
jgi:hypothetical protein